jgi:hypothetical protein
MWLFYPLSRRDLQLEDGDVPAADGSHQGDDGRFEVSQSNPNLDESLGHGFVDVELPSLPVGKLLYAFYFLVMFILFDIFVDLWILFRWIQNCFGQARAPDTGTHLGPRPDPAFFTSEILMNFCKFVLHCDPICRRLHITPLLTFQCSGSGIRCFFDPWIRNPEEVFSDPGSQTQIFDSLVTIF